MALRALLDLLPGDRVINFLLRSLLLQNSTTPKNTKKKMRELS